MGKRRAIAFAPSTGFLGVVFNFLGHESTSASLPFCLEKHSKSYLQSKVNKGPFFAEKQGLFTTLFTFLFTCVHFLKNSALQKSTGNMSMYLFMLRKFDLPPGLEETGKAAIRHPKNNPSYPPPNAVTARFPNPCFCAPYVHTLFNRHLRKEVAVIKQLFRHHPRENSEQCSLSQRRRQK
jgi:hypothetical protein